MTSTCSYDVVDDDANAENDYDDADGDDDDDLRCQLTDTETSILNTSMPQDLNTSMLTVPYWESFDSIQI